MSYKPDKMNIWNEGVTQTYINDGIHSPEKIRTKWKANYDLNKGAEINIDTLNNHGKKTKVRIGLTNDELSRLVTMLKTPTVDIPIDQRLQYDLMKPQQQPVPRLLNGRAHTRFGRGPRSNYRPNYRPSYGRTRRYGRGSRRRNGRRFTQRYK